MSTVSRAISTAVPCRLEVGQTAGLRNVTLSNGLIRAEILLDKGANVRQLWHAPTQTRTLAETADWRQQLAAFASTGRAGSSYCDFYEGGWQDVLPADSCDDDRSTSEIVGEAAIVPWELARSLCTPASASAICRVRLPRSGLEAIKRFTLLRHGAALKVNMTIRNTSGADRRFTWTQHPAFGGDLLDEHCHVHLPRGRVGSVRSGSEGLATLYSVIDGSGDVDGNPVIRSVRDLLPTADSADRFITIADLRHGDASIVNPGQRLGVRLCWDHAVFPNVWLWCARRQAIRCVAIEPSTTYLPELLPDSPPRMFHLLRPNETLRTWVELSLIMD